MIRTRSSLARIYRNISTKPTDAEGRFTIPCDVRSIRIERSTADSKSGLSLEDSSYTASQTVACDQYVARYHCFFQDILKALNQRLEAALYYRLRDISTQNRQ
jgi:hypothetical protein